MTNCWEPPIGTGGKVGGSAVNSIVIHAGKHSGRRLMSSLNTVSVREENGAILFS